MDALLDYEVRTLKALLRLRREPLEEVAEATLELFVTNLYDHGAPVWARLQERGLVMWQVDHWRLVDEDATRRALAVEALQEPERSPEWRFLDRPIGIFEPGVPIGLQITEDGGKKVSRGP